MEDQLAYLSLERSVRVMRILGIYPIDPDSEKNQRDKHNAYRRIIMFLVVLYSVQQILKVYEVRDDADEVMATMFLFLTHTDFIFKAAVFEKKSQKIEEILSIIKGPIYNQSEPEHRDLLLKTAQRALTIVRIFNYMALFTCFLWSLHPTILHIQEKTIELPVWLPFDSNSNPQFYITIVYMWIQTSWVALGNTIVDGFIAFALEQCKTQLSIVRLNLESVVEKSKEIQMETSRTFSDIVGNILKKIVIHHQEIINMTTNIQNIFGNALFYQFVVAGWILCTSAYRMVNVNPASVEFVSMIFYINCILIELFLYCFYGNEITFESELLMKSAYAMDWLSLPVKHRKTLIIFMERIKHPIIPTAGYIIPLSCSTFVQGLAKCTLLALSLGLAPPLEAFTYMVTGMVTTKRHTIKKIVRSSYTFYAFLKNSDKD